MGLQQLPRFCNPLGGDVRLRLGTSPGAATAEGSSKSSPKAGSDRGVTLCKPACRGIGGARAALVRRRLLVLVRVSPFLKFAILIGEKSFRIWTPAPTPRASLCMDPGGSMKGAQRPERAGAAAAFPPLRASTSCLGMMSSYGWAPLQAQRPLRRHSIQTATLLCRLLRCAGGNAASVASLTRFPPTASALGGLRAAAKGAGDAVLDPEGWALWVTGLCLPLSS